MEKLYKFSETASPAYKVLGYNLDNPISDFFKLYREIRDANVVLDSVSGGKFGDLIAIGIYNGFTKRFLDLLKNHGIDNFKPNLLKIKDKDSPAYYFIDLICKKPKKYKSIIKCMNMIDFSGIDPSWLNLDRVYFNYDDWNGEDLFTVENTFVFICTEKVKKIIEKAKLKNVKFKELLPVSSA